jgi:radial spoke head protein 1
LGCRVLLGGKWGGVSRLGTYEYFNVIFYNVAGKLQLLFDTVSSELECKKQSNCANMGDEEGSNPTYRVVYMDGDMEGSKSELTHVSRAGFARVVYANGDSFEGMFNDLKQRHGKGTYSYQNAPVAEGEEEAGDEEGSEGKKSAAAVYSGDFRFGKKDGVGKMKYPNGSIYNGSWKNDIKSGSGSYTYPNGDVYTGRWSNDVKSGRGSYYFAKNGSTLVGTWENGTMKSGKWVHADNTSYHGSFNGSAPQGSGVYYFKSGNVLEGKYESKTNGEDEEEGTLGPASFVTAPETLSFSAGATAADLANFCERDPAEIKEIKDEIAARELLLNPPPPAEEAKEDDESKEEVPTEGKAATEDGETLEA